MVPYSFQVFRNQLHDANARATFREATIQGKTYPANQTSGSSNDFRRFHALLTSIDEAVL